MKLFPIFGLAAILLGGCAGSSLDSFAPVAGSAAVVGADAATPPAGEPGVAPTAGFGPGRNAPSSYEGEATMAIPAPTDQEDNSAVYRIGPQDLVDIAVFKVPELSVTVQVSERGAVNLPLVGEIAVAGKTARDLERELTRQLGRKYLHNPQVNVLVKEYNSQRVVVEGAVNKPGVLPLRGGMSLLQAIALSQGMEDISDETVLVFRNSGGKRMAAKFDVGEIREGNAQDPQLQDGDVVIVGTSEVRRYVNRFMKLVPLASVFTLL